MSNIKHLFRILFIFLDKNIIIPVTKFFLWFGEKTTKNSKSFEKLLSRKSSLILISLALSLFLFFFVDAKSIMLLETSAEVIYNQKVNAIYNEEAYVIEGLPLTVDITLIGRKSDLYLAKQLPAHEVAIDLKDLKAGTHRVSLKYKGAIETISYKLDPSIASVTIYPKVSEVRTINVDILNQDKLNSKLIISKIDINREEVIIKGAEYKLNKVATVKALVDINNLSNPEVGDIELKDISLIAYDEKGIAIDVEMVPAKVSANITVVSPKKTVPIKIVPIGETAFGKAISVVTSSVEVVTIYGDQETLDKITNIPIEIDVTGVTDKKRVTATIKKPSGVRFISENSTVINVTLELEVTKEIPDIKIEQINLSSNLEVTAISKDDIAVTVIAKGVESVLNDIDVSTIKVYVDLKGYGVGTHEVDVIVEGTDLRVNYVPKIKKVNLIVKNKKS